LYFKPTTTIGYGKYKLDIDHTISYNIELGFKFKVYIERHVNTDVTLLANIKDNIIIELNKALKEQFISLVDLAALIRSKMSDVVYSIDVLGIDVSMPSEQPKYNIEMQTISIADETTRASIRKQLVRIDNDIATKYLVDVVFETI
jgi:hypothetical protein